MKLVCPKCQVELYPKQNGVYCINYDGYGEPYQVDQCDIWACGECNFEVAGGFTKGPIAERYHGYFNRFLADIEQGNSRVIINRGRKCPEG